MLSITAEKGPLRLVRTDVRPEPSSRPAEEVIRPLIDGRRIGGEPHPVQLLNPATAKPFARIAYATGSDMDHAVESASGALSLWRSVAFQDRARKLRRLADRIHADAWSIARVIAEEQGKPWLEALHHEVLPALDHLRFIIEFAERYHGGLDVEPRHPFYAHKEAHYLYDAIGVIALVTPSPLPFALPLVQVAAALAMGNAVILKPSERTPMSGLRIGELCAEVGFPPGLVNVVPALPACTLRLVTHPRVDKVFFTGSVDAGRRVHVAAGCEVRPTVLGLGGKHPAVVAGDADLGRAARGIVWGALANSGQNCGSIERVYVEECVAAEFIDRVVHEVKRLRLGNPLTEEVDVGPLQSAARRQEVHRQVNDAVRLGARVLCGGAPLDTPGFFYQPTVLVSVPNDCALMQQETLGPVIPIIIVDTIERAILLANECDLALTASGWTQSEHTAQRLMVGLPAGVVTINDVLYSFGEPAATWSGHRMSGFGQSHGTPGLREMSRQRFVSFDRQHMEAPLFSFPSDVEAASMAQSSLDHLHGKGRFGRLVALGRLLRLKRFRSRVSLRSFLFPGSHKHRKN